MDYEVGDLVMIENEKAAWIMRITEIQPETFRAEYEQPVTTNPLTLDGTYLRSGWYLKHRWFTVTRNFTRDAKEHKLTEDEIAFLTTLPEEILCG